VRPTTKRRKQTIKFRPKYAGRVAKEWSRRAVRCLFVAGVAGGTLAGAAGARHFWAQSDTFRIHSVILQGDIPAGLENRLPFDRNGNLLAFRPATVRRTILADFPELQNVSVHRSWSKNVVITGHYRTPLAWFSDAGKIRFIDKTGVVFALPEKTVDTGRLPELQSERDGDRQMMLRTLAHWAARFPAFSSQIVKCETDTIHRLQVKLADGTVVEWGAMDAAVLDVRTQRVLRVLDNYHPTQTPAKLLFVDDDRLVMDSHWAPTKPL
jgi:cell division septal protein FtsQ